MEIIIALVVLAGLAYIASKSFGKKAAEVEVVVAAPYKVETPEAKVVAVNAQPIAEVKPAPVKKAPVAKKPVAKKAPVAKKPVTKAPAKKALVAKKPVAKKPVAKKAPAKKTATK